MQSITGREVFLSVGGIVFRLTAGERLLVHDVGPFYRPFVGEGPAGAPADSVHVRFEVVRRPSFDGETIFRSEASWRVLARGGERAFVYNEPWSAEPLYVARFRPGAQVVDVACAPSMVEPDGRGGRLRSPFRYPLDQILTMYALGKHGFVVHAAGLVHSGRGVAFPGVSGAGKSTIAGLATARGGWRPLSDDRVLLRLREGGAVLHGTPWAGEGRIAENDAAPAAALLFLEKGDCNAVRDVGPSELLARLLPVVSIPWFDREYLPDALAACERVATTIRGGVLEFRREPGAVDAVERYLEAGPGGATG